ncbi:MAG: hypothetical protein QXG52_07955 [Candidatus Caldarchaeum sp.]
MYIVKPAVISIIGSGSVVFTGRLIIDLCLTKGLHGCTVNLMEIDRERLNTIYQLAVRYSREINTDITRPTDTQRVVYPQRKSEMV